MHHIKDFIIDIKFGIDLQDLKIHNRKVMQCNWIEALAGLNKELRLIGAVNCQLYIDWKLDSTMKLQSKRYLDDAILNLTLQGLTWSMHSKEYSTVAANVMNIKQHLELQRKARNKNISITVKYYSNEPKKVVEDNG